MIASKIKAFFSNKENVILSFLSLALASNSLFFVVSKIQRLSFLSVNHFSLYITFAYFALSAIVIGTILFFNRKFNLLKTLKKILLVYLPTQIILVYGIEKILCSGDNTVCLMINNLLPFATVVYFILLGYLIIALRKKEKPQETISFQNWIKKQGTLAISLVFLVVILNLAFGNYHLTQKASVDEALWTFDRIPKFWNNVMDGEWQKTNVSDKPGITVALISGTGLLKLDPKEYKSVKWPGDIEGSEKNVLDMNFALRFPILLFNALMLFVFYFFVEKLLGKKTAIFSLIFIGLSPILLGISTIINPDSLLWVFLPLSMLSYFVYRKEETNVYLYWSGIFLGLSLLTKYVGNILYVFFFLLIFLEYIFKDKKPDESVALYLKKSILDYFTLMFFSLLTFFVLLPASWVEISRLLDGTILSKAFQKIWVLFLLIIAFIAIDSLLFKGRLVSVLLKFFSKCRKLIAVTICSIFLAFTILTLLNTYFQMQWFNFESILASPKSSFMTTEFFGLFLTNFFSLIFGILPIVLLALIFFTLKNIREKTIVAHEDKIGIYLALFILLYYFASAIDGVSATVRYQIVVYPIAFMLAAIGMKQFLDIKIIKKYVPSFIIYFIVLFFSVYSLNSIKPFYFSYASDLLPQKYVLNLKDMGDGSYEAAQYLNNLPNAKNLVIWTDKKGVCTFFLGAKCLNEIGINKDEIKIDYFVVSSGRESRTSKMTLARFNGGNQAIIRLDKLYGFENPDFYLKIGDRPNCFVKVISEKNIFNN